MTAFSAMLSQGINTQNSLIRHFSAPFYSVYCAYGDQTEMPQFAMLKVPARRDGGRFSITLRSIQIYRKGGICSVSISFYPVPYTGILGYDGC
jgi:hypothetical protein